MPPSSHYFSCTSQNATAARRIRGEVQCDDLRGRLSRLEAPPLGAPRNGILLTEPLGYLDFLCLMKHATLVVTDSGGIQEETTCLGVPCVTVRNNTERPVTTKKAPICWPGRKVTRSRMPFAIKLPGTSSSGLPEKWDGQAATRIVAILVQVGKRTGRKFPVSRNDAEPPSGPRSENWILASPLVERHLPGSNPARHERVRF